MCTPAAELDGLPAGTRVAVAGIVFAPRRTSSERGGNLADERAHEVARAASPCDHALLQHFRPGGGRRPLLSSTGGRAAAGTRRCSARTGRRRAARRSKFWGCDKVAVLAVVAAASSLAACGDRALNHRVSGLDLSRNGLSGELLGNLASLDLLRELRLDGNGQLGGRLWSRMTVLPLRILSYDGTILFESTGGRSWDDHDNWLTGAPLDARGTESRRTQAAASKGWTCGGTAWRARSRPSWEHSALPECRPSLQLNSVGRNRRPGSQRS